MPVTVSLANELERHKVWCPSDEMYVTGIPYDNGQVVEEPEETFVVMMHFRVNVLLCAHPDFDWLGGIEVEIHQDQPKVKVVRKGILRRSKHLVMRPLQN